MEHLQIKFIEEATDLIASLEKALLELEHKPSEKSLIEQVFRVMHTLKGNSSMFGFDQVGEITHHLETLYELIREDKIVLSQELFTITLASVDHLRELINNPNSLNKQNQVWHEQLIKDILKIVNSIAGTQLDIASVPDELINKKDIESVGVKTYYILFRPKEDVFANGTNPLYLLDELHSLGTCKVTAHTKHIPDLDYLTITKCYTYWDIYLATSQPVSAIKEIFLFVEDEGTVEIHKVADNNLLIHQKFLDKIEELSHTQEGVNYKELQAYINSLLQINLAQPSTANQAKDKEKQLKAGKEQANASIRVSSDKLDMLMSLVSELVTTQARLSLLATNSLQPELLVVAENIEKISRQLRDNTFSICLIPIENMLIRFQRLVRDISHELKKDIVFVTEGAETELDKTIIEKLADPLMHILRDSLDHGIEEPEERDKLGKPKKGKIVLRAFYSGTNVHIQVQDDGAGIDLGKIRNKAISRGIIHADTILSDKETLDLIFLPGFSTAAKVTEVSGRGVGMDVVKRNITDIRGEVELSSKVNVGTTITIKLPLTLSIIDGLLVKIEDTHFVIPLTVVDRCYEVNHHQLADSFNNLVALDGERIPFCYLREEFSITAPVPDREKIVVLNYDDKKVGVVVDTIIGEYQAVLKPLGKLYKYQEIISGATILGDGTIALVMDTNKIIKQFSGERDVEARLII